MEQYAIGEIIRKLREEHQMTQHQLAEKLNVSDKAVSRWETWRGYPDLALIEPLAEALGVSIIELLSGENVKNTNRSVNMLRLKFYVCPVCGNVIWSTGESVISCCGVNLPVQKAQEPQGEHAFNVERVEDEYYVTVPHDMTKDHFISFIAAVKDNGCEVIKLYPEGGAEARFKISRTDSLYFFCNQHGLFKTKISDLK